MKSHEALKLAAGEQQTSLISDIAERLHMSRALIYKWTQPAECPTDSGARNPVDVLKQYIETCLVLGRPANDALAPLDHLDHHFNRVAITLPNCKNQTQTDVQTALLVAIKECGDVVAAYNEAMGNFRIDKKDVARIENEVWQAITKLVGYLYVLRGVVKQ